MGTDEDGLQIPPPPQGRRKEVHARGRQLWRLPKAKNQLKMLANWEEIKQLCSEATVVCGLPLLSYIKERCCLDSTHVNKSMMMVSGHLPQGSWDSQCLPWGGLPRGNHFWAVGCLWLSWRQQPGWGLQLWRPLNLVSKGSGASHTNSLRWSRRAPDKKRSQFNWRMWPAPV